MRRIQFYVDEKKDAMIEEYIQRLEGEADGKRGYVNDKIKEMVKFFILMTEEYNEHDAMTLTAKVMSNKQQTIAPQGKDVQQKQVKQEEGKDLESIEDMDDDNWGC